MASVNEISILGNVGKDAALRYTASGAAQAEFSVAVNSRRKSGDEWVDDTTWFNVVAFGDMAERVSQHITKGKQLFVSGRMTERRWDDDKGTKHSRWEVIANNIQLLGSRDSTD